MKNAFGRLFHWERREGHAAQISSPMGTGHLGCGQRQSLASLLFQSVGTGAEQRGPMICQLHCSQALDQALKKSIQFNVSPEK